MAATDIPYGSRARLAGYGYGAAAVVLWSLYMAYARAGINVGLSPADFVVIRSAAAATVLFPWFIVRSPARLGSVGWAKGTVLAIAAGPPFIAVGIAGYLFAPLSHGAVVQPASVTLFSMLLAVLVLREPLPPYRIAGALIMIAGVYLVAGGSGAAAANGAWLGDLLFIIAGFMWGWYAVLMRYWRLEGLQATIAVSIISALVVVPVALTYNSIDRLATLSIGMLLTQFVVQGVFSGVLAVVTFSKAVELLGASTAAIFPAVVPAFTLVIGIPITGEVPSLVEWIGAIVTCVGLAVAVGVVHRLLLRDFA